MTFYFKDHVRDYIFFSLESQLKSTGVDIINKKKKKTNRIN
jgi:hypothetical protein